MLPTATLYLFEVQVQEERQPTALVIHCGGDGSVIAAEAFMEVLVAADAR